MGGNQSNSRRNRPAQHIDKTSDSGCQSRHWPTTQAAPSNHRALSTVVGAVTVLGLVIALVAILLFLLSGVGDSLQANAAAGVAFDEEPGQGLETSLITVDRGDEFYLIDGSGEKVPGSTMTDAGDRIQMDVVCDGGIGETVRVIGVLAELRR